MTDLCNFPVPVRSDLPWQREAIERARVLYGSTGSVFTIDWDFNAAVASAVRSSPYMIQALEAFPALAVLLETGALDLGAVARGERLWPLAARHQLRRQLRVLQGPVVRYHRNVVGPHLCHAHLKIFWRLSPAQLATLVPAHPRGQGWLLFLARLIDACYQDIPASNLIWLLKQYLSIGDIPSGAFNLIDFMRRAGRPFDGRWSLQRAMAECDAWHDRQAYEARVLELGTCADYGCWPLECVVGVYTFTALRSPRQLGDETRIMRHCVAAYADDVLQGRSRIYAVRGAGERATVEWRTWPHDTRFWHVTQIKGPCNAEPSDAIKGALQVFIARLRIEELELTRTAMIPASTKGKP